MSEYTKDQTEAVMDALLAGLESDVFIEDDNYYSNLYPEPWDEGELAGKLSSYPELVEKGAAIVEKIIHLIRNEDAYSIWVNDEVQAGSYLAYVLAMNDKKYCGLFARLLAVQDMDHEVEQNDDIKSILDKWGICPETIEIIDARLENPGQWGGIFFEELLESGKLKGTKYVVDKAKESGTVGIAERFAEDLAAALNSKMDGYIQAYKEKTVGQEVGATMRIHINISNDPSSDIGWLKDRFQKIKILIKKAGPSDASVEDMFELPSTGEFLEKACSKKILDGVIRKKLTQWLVGEFDALQSKGFFGEEIELYVHVILDYRKEKELRMQFYVYREDGKIQNKKITF